MSLNASNVCENEGIPEADTGNYGGSFQVAIEPSEVKKSIPEYLVGDGNFRSSFLINVRQVPSRELARSLHNKFYANVLQLTHDYENANVQYDEHSNFYRISNWESPPPFLLWKVLSLKPDKKAVVPENLNDYFIATCSRADGLTRGNITSTSCEYSLEIMGYLAEVHTSERNLSLKEKLNDFAQNLLVSWSQNCK